MITLQSDASTNTENAPQKGQRGVRVCEQSDAANTASEQKTELAKRPRFKSKLRSPSPKYQHRVGKQTKQKVEVCLSAAEAHSPYVKSLMVLSASERIIECLCTTIRNIRELRPCVGILVTNNIKHRVWVPRAPLTSARVLSLAELLSMPEPPRRERLKLGLRLASSVLQLHGTEWLKERWGKQDIYLIQGGSSQPRDPSLEIPVVSQAFTPAPSVSEVTMESHIISCNLSLFSLGIVLIELWFWKSAESFETNKPQAYSCLEDLDTARLVTAKRLIRKLYGDAGDNYGNIVRRCISGLDHKETQLENDGFKNKVYRKVLQPLEKNLELFCDEPLEKIFGKGS